MKHSQFKKEVDRIKVPEDKLDATIQNSIKKGRAKKSFGKKIAYVSNAAALFICLLFGSAFVSPTMADTLAKVPVLGSVFQLGDPGYDIMDELKEQGYKIKGVSFIYNPDKVVEVLVGGSEGYLADVKDEVKKITENFLQSKHYDSYAVKVIDRREGVETEPETGMETKQLTKEEQREQEMHKKVLKAIEKVNFKQGSASISFGYGNNSITIPIQGTQKYYNKMKDDVKNAVNQVLKASGFENYIVQVPRLPINKVKEEKWKLDLMPVIQREMLGKKEYHVTDIKSSMEENVMQLNIDVSLQSSNSSVKQLAEVIQENVTKIVESKKFESIVSDFPYEINVYSKDQKLLNSSKK